VFVRPGLPAPVPLPGVPNRSIADLTAYAPRFVPRPLTKDGCDLGADVVLTLADGTNVTYGPCVRPRSIDRLWEGIERVSTGRTCPPPCLPDLEGSPPGDGQASFTIHDASGLAVGEAQVHGTIEGRYACPPHCLPPGFGVAATVVVRRVMTGHVAARTVTAHGPVPSSFVVNLAPGFYELQILPDRRSEPGLVCPGPWIVVAEAGRAITLAPVCILTI